MVEGTSSDRSCSGQKKNVRYASFWHIWPPVDVAPVTSVVRFCRAVLLPLCSCLRRACSLHFVALCACSLFKREIDGVIMLFLCFSFFGKIRHPVHGVPLWRVRARGRQPLHPLPAGCRVSPSLPPYAYVGSPRVLFLSLKAKLQKAPVPFSYPSPFSHSCSPSAPSSLGSYPAPILPFSSSQCRRSSCSSSSSFARFLLAQLLNRKPAGEAARHA